MNSIDVHGLRDSYLSSPRTMTVRRLRLRRVCFLSILVFFRCLTRASFDLCDSFELLLLWCLHVIKFLWWILVTYNAFERRIPKRNIRTLCSIKSSVNDSTMVVEFANSSTSTWCIELQVLANASTCRYYLQVPPGTCKCKYLKVLFASTSRYLQMQVAGGTICKYLQVLANASTYRYNLQVPSGTCKCK